MNIVIFGVIITLLTCIPVLMQLRTHPRGLFILFFAEMWERFSYYGMRGLLIFYLTQHFLIDDASAQGQYGGYAALIYLVPLVGGVVADQFLGTRKAVVFGALLLVAGHFTMAFSEGPPATQTLIYGGHTYEFQVTGRMEQRHACLKVVGGCYDVGQGAAGGELAIKGLPAPAPLPPVLAKDSYVLGVTKAAPVFANVLYLALALIIMGVGFLKANITSIAGQLYGANDPRRDPGFTLYYYGVNLGAFWAAILCGWAGSTLGWWAGFGMAGVGMLAGFLVFTLGKPLLEGKGEPPDPARLKRKVAGPVNAEWSVYLLALLGVGVVWVLVQRFELVGYMLGVASFLVLSYLGWFMVRRCTVVERDRLILALALMAGGMVFFTLFEQAGSSLNQFAERNTQLPSTGPFAMTAAQTQQFNPGFILIFAPVFSALWAWLGQRGRDPNPTLKFGIALLQVGAGFFVLVWGANFADAGFRVPLVFLILAYLLHTTGELCLSPVGISQMTRLAPAALISTVMAIWFLSTAWAEWVAGLVAGLTATKTVAGQVLDPAGALHTYAHVFGLVGLWGAGAGVVMIALSPWLKRLAHAVRE